MRGALVGLSLMSLACSGGGSDPASIAALQREIKSLRAEVERIDTTLDDLSNNDIKQRLSRPATATFSPASKSYQPVFVGPSVFLVSLHKVQPYANGQELTFHIGNPQAIAYSGAKLKVGWGKEFEVGAPGGFKAWRDSFREKEEELHRDLARGAWNAVKVVVAPATAEEIGHIEFAMEVSTVSMPVH